MSVLRSPLISFTEDLHNNRWYQEETVGILSSSSFIKVIVIIDDCQGFHGDVMNHSFPQNLQHHLRSMILIILMPLEGLGLSRLKMQLNQQSLFYNT